MRATLTKALKNQIRLQSLRTKHLRRKELKAAMLAKYEKVCTEVDKAAAASILEIPDLSVKEIQARLESSREICLALKVNRRSYTIQSRIGRTLKVMRAKGISKFTIRDVIEENPALNAATVRDIVKRLVACDSLDVFFSGRGQGRQTIYSFKPKTKETPKETSCSQ